MSYPQASVGALTDVDTVQRNVLGQRRFVGKNEYMYLQGVASTVAGDWVVYDEAGLTVRLITGAITGPVAIAQAAVLANQFGWYLIFGSGQANVAAAFADNGLIFSTGTAGVADDAIVADSQVLGAVGRSAISGSQALVQVSYPYFGDTNGA